MNRRLKKFVFPHSELYTDGLDFIKMTAMFQQIPQGAKIVGWGDCINQMASYFVVESASFDEVPECEMIPEGKLEFSKPTQKIKWDVSATITKDALLKARDSIDKFNTEYLCNFVGVVALPPAPGLDGGLNIIENTPELISPFRTLNLVYGDGRWFEIDPPFSKAPTVTASCNHSWKTYNGFTDNYEYCEVCNEKK